uniref:Uncharacterized protein n=1 Tax=Glycine max TaxID=3847 RepID=K7N3R4_SOYBN
MAFRNQPIINHPSHGGLTPFSPPSPLFQTPPKNNTATYSFYSFSTQLVNYTSKMQTTHTQQK